MTTENGITVKAPLVESFLSLQKAKEIWPEEITNNHKFVESIEQRQKLLQVYDKLCHKIKHANISLEEALKSNFVTEKEVAKFFNTFSEFLENHEEYQRIILYFPFELLPDVAWHPKNRKLEEAKNRFQKAYRKSWEYLFKYYDVRTNFVDGDVLEENYFNNGHPRIVKAAHLLPFLVSKGIFSINEVFSLIEKKDDKILRHSLADALPVLADLNLLTTKDLEIMTRSDDNLLVSMAKIIQAKMLTRKAEKQTEEFNLSLFQEELEKKLLTLENANYGQISQKRKDWLISEKNAQVISKISNEIETAITKKQLTISKIYELLAANPTISFQQALVEGLRSFILSSLTDDESGARKKYDQFANIFLQLWQTDNPELKNTLTISFRQFYHAGIISETTLKNFGITIPKLSGPFSENLKLMKEDLEEITDIVTKIKSSSELSQMIYPVVLIYGSRLKGYGEEKSDIDLSIFIKPNISFSERTRLQTLIRKAFAGTKIKTEEIVEFWLEEKNGDLNIRDIAIDDIVIGDLSQSHVFFGGAWIGKKEEIKDLQRKLLTKFLMKNDLKFHGQSLHNVHLGELERDTLLYRLLHKGYKRFFASCGGINTANAEDIDGNSYFYDSGYRRLATRLYLNRVFLPQVSKI